MPETKTAFRVEAHIAGGIYSLNRFLMTVQSKRMPVTHLDASMGGEQTRVRLTLDCPEDTARRYMKLLEGLEDAREVGEVEEASG